MQTSVLLALSTTYNAYSSETHTVHDAIIKAMALSPGLSLVLPTTANATATTQVVFKSCKH